MAQVTTSVTINFNSALSAGDSGANAFQAEIDSRDDGYNKGQTSFYPGDTVYILLFKGSNITGVTSKTSSGTLTAWGTTTVERKEQVTLANTREFSTGVPITGAYSFVWYGGEPSGGVNKVGESKFTAGDLSVAVGEITYQASADVYALSGVEFPAAVVVFIGDAP